MVACYKLEYIYGHTSGKRDFLHEEIVSVSSVDDRTLIMAVFFSSGIDYSQVMWIWTILGVEG